MPLDKLITIFFFSILFQNGFAQENRRILISYGKLNPDEIKNYDLVILEANQYCKEDITTLRKHNKKVLAYICLTEVNKNTHFYKALKPYVLGKNKIWDSYYLDLSSEEVKKIIFNLLQEYIDKGCNGFFLDNIDNVTQHGPHPEQKPYLIELIKDLRTTFKTAYITQNAGLELLDDTNDYIDDVAVESVITAYDFKDNSYQLRNKEESKNYLARLEKLSKDYNINFILIEYANNIKLYKKVKKQLQKTGHDYFVGEIELQNVPKY